MKTSMLMVAVAVVGLVLSAAFADPHTKSATTRWSDQSATTRWSDPNVDAEKFRQAYKSATRPSERRDLVLKAIDQQLIRPGTGLDRLKKMFGDQIQIQDKNEATGKHAAWVFFTPAKPPSNPLMSAEQRGWYIDFQFTDGWVSGYGLSNIHKGAFTYIEGDQD